MNQSDIDRIEWYHAMELEPGGLKPKGRFGKNIPPNYTLFPVFQFLEQIDLKGLDCLDIGTTDGIIAFIMSMQGGQVVATDRANRESFHLVREHLGLLDVKYLPETTLDNGDLETKLLHQDLPTKYDLVVLSGVIYHAYDPLRVMMYARRLIKPEGLLIVESAYHPGSDAVLYMNWDAQKPVPEPNTYFLPTIKGLHSMLHFCCCAPIATVTNVGRVGVLARAKSPKSVTGKSSNLEMIFSKSACYGPLDFSELDDVGQAKSDIRHTVPKGERSIDWKKFSTSLPLQPEWKPKRS